MLKTAHDSAVQGSCGRGALVRALLLPLLLAAPAFAGAACPDFLDHDFRKLHASDSINLCKAFAGNPCW